MPRLRSIQQLMSAPILAIDQRGMQRLAANCLAHAKGAERFASMMTDDSPVRTEEEANGWREFMKSTGVFPYYVNPSGSIVHTLDTDVDERIQQGAIAVIPVQGALVREAWAGEEVFYGLVSSDRLTKFIRSVMYDTRVVGAVATVNSPGGMVSGTDKLGQAWQALGAQKKTVLHVDDLCASAAVWFGCSSGSIQLDGRTCEVGSVGVMMSFFDWIPMLESLGIKYVELYAPESDKKNEDWRKLREQQDPALYKESLSQTAQLFRKVVQEGRGAKLSTTVAAVLEGRMYAGQDAIDVGLADGFGDLDACLQLVRSETPTQEAPAAAPPPTQVPPNNEVIDEATTTPTKKMSIKTRLVALVAALFSTTEAVKAEDIDAANAELLEKEITGVAIVSTEELETVKEASTRIADAEAKAAAAVTAQESAEAAATTAQESEAKATTTLSALEAELRTAAETAGVEVAEGTAVSAALVAALQTERTALDAARTEIATLKGEAAPSAAPAGPVNTEGDVHAGDVPAHEKEFQQWVND